MRKLTLALFLATLLLAACVDRNSGTGTAPRVTSGGSAPVALPRVLLVRSDLGLGDGDFVRGADAALRQLADKGALEYATVGKLPQPLTQEAAAQDVGMPIPKGSGPGEMTLGEGRALLAGLPASGILVLSSGYLLQDALQAAAGKQIETQAILLLDEQGMGALPAAPPVPVFRVRYPIQHMAFPAGVAAAASASVAHFAIMYAADDPQGERFANAAAAGAKYQSNGAWSESISVPVGPDGFVTPAEFSRALAALKAQGGANWRPDHFILALGRSTPTIANALSKKPTNAYVVTGYGDYRQVRPARVLGCALKLPGNALAELFGKLDMQLAATDPAAALRAVCAPDGVFEASLAANAVGFTGFEMYGRYNQDSDDIKEAVEGIIGVIRAGELGVDY